MLLLGDKQGTVMEYKTCILMALGVVVHYLIVFIYRKKVNCILKQPCLMGMSLHV